MPLKGVSMVAGIIFLALTISAAAIVYQAGVPAVQNIQSASAVEKMKATLSELDKVIRDVASQGLGAKKTISISSDPGVLTINGTTNSIIWELETAAQSISPRTSQQFGNLIVGSNLETSVSEVSYTRTSPATPALLLENERLQVYINRTGLPGNQTPIATKSLVMGIYNKGLASWLDNAGFLQITIDGNANSQSGTGYTQATATGDHLPFGKVKAFMDTTYIDYNIYFILESGADFLTIEAEEAS